MCVCVFCFTYNLAVKGSYQLHLNSSFRDCFEFFCLLLFVLLCAVFSNWLGNLSYMYKQQHAFVLIATVLSPFCSHYSDGFCFVFKSFKHLLLFFSYSFLGGLWYPWINYQPPHVTVNNIICTRPFYWKSAFETENQSIRAAPLWQNS